MSAINPSDIKVTCRKPNDVDRADEESFKQLVLSAGEVPSKTLPGLYNDALILSFAKSGERLVGVGAIKRPSPEYRDRVFRNANSAIPSSDFCYELGWFHVLGEFRRRGISRSMVEKLMPFAEGKSVYATSRIDNEAMHTALTNHGGFVAEGSDYSSPQRSAVMLRLFVRHIGAGSARHLLKTLM